MCIELVVKRINTSLVWSTQNFPQSWERDGKLIFFSHIMCFSLQENMVENSQPFSYKICKETEEGKNMLYHFYFLTKHTISFSLNPFFSLSLSYLLNIEKTWNFIYLACFLKNNVIWFNLVGRSASTSTIRLLTYPTLS